MPVQWAVYRHPESARSAHPYLVCLQSELARVVESAVVAPLTPSNTMQGASTRLFPEIYFNHAPYRVLIPQLAAISPRILHEPVGELGQHREALLVAIDLLFTGI